MLGGCSIGDAKITKGYELPAKYVIHTVGPVWKGGNSEESVQLGSCYQRCLEVAQENGVRTIAFPSISTGVYGYPIEDATEIAVRTVHNFLTGSKRPIEVTFCCFSENDLSVYDKYIQRHTSQQDTENV